MKCADSEGFQVETTLLGQRRHAFAVRAESPCTTLNLALHVAESETMHQATPFLQRIDARRERDRKRLQDYYRTLQRESDTPNKRTKTVPTAEEIESRQKAVKRELQNKLSELLVECRAASSRAGRMPHCGSCHRRRDSVKSREADLSSLLECITEKDGTHVLQPLPANLIPLLVH